MEATLLMLCSLAFVATASVHWVWEPQLQTCTVRSSKGARRSHSSRSMCMHANIAADRPWAEFSELYARNDCPDGSSMAQDPGEAWRDAEERFWTITGIYSTDCAHLDCPSGYSCAALSQRFVGCCAVDDEYLQTHLG